MNSLISFIVVLGILILVHELGHFLFAKLFGVRVLKFSLGFGPKIIGRKFGETEYLLSAFPLGGYVKMFGEQQGEQEVGPADEPFSFSHKPVWQRFGIVAGGPFFNLAFAVFLFFLLLLVVGMPQAVDTTRIGQVTPGSVAESVGIKPGDVVMRLNDKPVSSWMEVSEGVKTSGGQPVGLILDRDGKEVAIVAVPAMEKIKNIFGEDVGERYMLGITRDDKVEYQDVSVGQALKASFVQTWDLISLTLMGLVKIFQRIIPATELGGPIRIAEIAGQQFEAGWLNFYYFMGLLSINLGILNLLPIPVLDGGHLVFLTIESIRRKPLSITTMENFQKVGIFLLGSLMIFVFYNDILRIVQRWMSS